MSFEKSEEDSDFSAEGVEIPVLDFLDLHSFHPRDLPVLIPEYLQECVRRGIFRVRLIHGKGKGVQRAQIRQLLNHLEIVHGFRDAPPELGHYGATLVWLKSP